MAEVAAPQAMASLEERRWAMACHLIALVGYVIPFGHIFGPLIIWILKREGRPLVDDQGKESLNFQISVTLYAIGAAFLILLLVGIALLVLLGLFHLILVVIATIRANEGVRFRYPLTLRFVR
jgi:uncharacterized Tic20 family protein